MLRKSLYIIAIASLLTSCENNNASSDTQKSTDKKNITNVVQPTFISEQTLDDTDDPAIWINYKDLSQSFVIGTDKCDTNGGVYAFNLEGEIIRNKTVLGLKRPNNVDIEYGFNYNNNEIDIAVCTERGTNRIRVFSLPDMKLIDNGGIDVFAGENIKERMGISLYKNSKNEVYAIVGRKFGPTGKYLWQYQLYTDAKGFVTGKKVREFGNFSEKQEIESIVVDDELGYVYYSDERFGVRQCYASPDSSNQELSVFATSEIKDDQEGLSIYPTSKTTGYILVSNQGAHQFCIYTREGVDGNPFNHKLLKVVNVAAQFSDGSDITPVNLNSTFKHGLFVAMSNNKTFHFYKVEDILGKELIPQ